MGFELFGKKLPSASKAAQAQKQNQILLAVSGKQKLMITVVIGSELLTEHGWKTGDKVALFFGTDTDKGKLLLKKSEEGTKLAPYNKKAAAGTPVAGLLMRGIQPAAPIEDFCNKPIPRGAVAHEWDADNEGFVVTLPASFFIGGVKSGRGGRRKKAQ